jgi:hypothetical protein
MYENVRAFAGNPEIDVVRGNFGEDQAAFARPRRAFEPFVEVACDLFGLCARRDDLIERRIKFLYFLRIRRRGENSDRCRRKQNENAATWKSFHAPCLPNKSYGVKRQTRERQGPGAAKRHRLQISRNNSHFGYVATRESRARIANGRQFPFFMQDFMRAIDHK